MALARRVETYNIILYNYNGWEVQSVIAERIFFGKTQFPNCDVFVNW